jgi:predicted AAA+ superfamily ATPase
VVLLGARQVGKTTLAKTIASEDAYYDLEKPLTRQSFLEDPSFQLAQARGSPVVLDEAQYVPEVFSALRGIIDEKRSINGRFLLLGSAQPSLVQGISESLAGRCGVAELSPLTPWEALQSDNPDENMPWPILWMRGGFAEALVKDFRMWWDAYLGLFCERDLVSYGLRPDPLLVRRLVTMLAHRQGQLLNASELGRSLGVNHQTIQRYIEVLEATFLVRRLSPYFRNIGKRLVKSPKIYLRDSGLLHHLLNIGESRTLESHPALGASWEGFVIEDLIRREQIQNPFTCFSFWRTAAGSEADLLMERSSEIIAFEIKASSGEDIHAARRLEVCLNDVGADRGFIIGRGQGIRGLTRRVECRGYQQCIDWLP